MPLHLEIVFRGLAPCVPLEALVRARTTLLRQAQQNPIASCRVVIDAALEQLGDDGRFRAVVEVMLRSGRRVASGSITATARTHPADAIDDAFDTLQEALESAPASDGTRKTTTRMRAVRPTG